MKAMAMDTGRSTFVAAEYVMGLTCSGWNRDGAACPYHRLYDYRRRALGPG